MSSPRRAPVDRGLRSLVEAAQAAVPEEDDRTRALLLARLAQALRLSPEIGRGVPMSVEAERIARRLGLAGARRAPGPPLDFLASSTSSMTSDDNPEKRMAARSRLDRRDDHGPEPHT